MADLRDMPDAFPALVTVACSLPAGSRLLGLDNLRHKESDRLSVMVENLRRLGASVQADQSTLVSGDPFPRGRHAAVGTPARESARNPVEVTAAGDHRIAMAMAVAALRSGPLVIDDPECVGKSFPGFWEAWERVIR
jgi:3-phosphoshikimate 1-carboxyvinyltransferase